MRTTILVMLAATAAAAACAPTTTATSRAEPEPAAKAAKAAPGPAKPAASATTAAKSATPRTATPAPTVAAAKPGLDLKGLEQRLKDSNAIGIMTKLSLKNQVDDLVGRFKSYHSGSRPPTIDQLRPSFDLLVMKVVSLLQDKDPGLAKDIHASRDTLWAVLADADKLARYS